MQDLKQKEGNKIKFIMKNLYDIRQLVSRESKEIEENYYATLTGVNVQGRFSLIVSEEDYERKFGEGFEKMFNLDMPIKLLVKFRQKSNDTKKFRDTIVVIIRQDGDTKGVFTAIFFKADGKKTRNLCLNCEEYKREWVAKFYPAEIHSWADLENLFHAMK